MLRPATDRRWHLLRVGGGEDEDDVARWLLERLQQRVGRRGREHVDLVDDVDLPAPRGAQAGVGDEVPHGVDAVVGGCIELVHIERAPLGDLDARGADTARFAVDRLLAVERLGQDAGGRRLAGAAGPAEEVGVRHPFVADGAPQRPHDVVLTPDLVESPGPESAVERDEGGVGHAGRAYPCVPTRRPGAGARCSVRRPGWLRHPAIPAESCCLPTLTRFTSGRCAGPGHRTQHRDGAPSRLAGHPGAVPHPDRTAPAARSARCASHQPSRRTDDRRESRQRAAPLGARGPPVASVRATVGVGRLPLIHGCTIREVDFR